MNYKIAQLTLNPEKKQKAVGEIYIAQPDMQKELLGGKIFILAEIKEKKEIANKILNFLIYQLEENYYQSDKLFLKEKISTIKVEHIFESAIAKLNKQFRNFSKQEKIRFSLSNLNITIGLIYENQLHFTTTGKNRAFLIYKTLDKKTNKKKYKIIDIIKEANKDDNSREKNSNKIFVNVISGSIPKSSYFLFTNEALPEYLSHQQFIEIITTLPPKSATEQIKNLLSRINIYIPFTAIIIKNTLNDQKTEKPKNVSYASATQQSIINLRQTEESTEQFLSPSGFVNIRKVINLLTNKKKQQAKEHFIMKDKIFAKKKPSFTFIKRILSILQGFIIYLLSLLLFIGKTIFNKNKLANLILNIKLWTKKKITTFVYWFNSLERKNKILLIASLIFLLSFVINLQILHKRNEGLKQQKQYQELVESIKKKQNQVEASLLYNNNEKAKQILKETEKLLQQMPQETPAEQQKYEEFYKKFIQQLEKIRKVVRLENLVELTNLDNVNHGANAENIVLLAAQHKIYIGDSKQKSIYILNIDNNTVTTATNFNQKIQSFSYPALNKKGNIYYYNQKSIIELNKDNEDLTLWPIQLPEKNCNIVDLDSYNNNIYLLDNNNQQIYKYLSTTNGFSRPQDWLKELVNLEGAINISIDGHIYVLKQDGTLLKFLRGRLKDFKLAEVDPELKNPTKLFVSPTLNYIYILDPSEKRLLLFNKKGEFIRQYFSDNFTNLKDFAVDEQNDIIYFLNGNAIYAASIEL